MKKFKSKYDNLNRRSFVEQAAIECLNEMYINSQPSITWDEVIKIAESDQSRHIWSEHYLHQTDYEYIMNKYIELYKIGEVWTQYVELVEEYLTNGGSKDKYIESHIDEYGNHHPGYRGYEHVKPIKEQIREIINNELGGGNVSEKIIDRIDNAVMNTISDCKGFYQFNREEMGFRMTVSNYSPSSNIEMVREFYKDNPDIKIEPESICEGMEMDDED